MGAHAVVPQAVMSVNLVWDISLCHQHQVIVPNMHNLDGLEEAKAPAVPDIVHSKVEP